MPLTVITLKKVPQSLRGDLTKWMQEIATGVYIGNFNTKVREELWNRVLDSVDEGEATISYSYRNEIGYKFDTINTNRIVINLDGIPLVRIENRQKINEEKNVLKSGFSNASKFRKMKKFLKNEKSNANYVVIDIETDGLDKRSCSIIELGAVKFENSKFKEFNILIKSSKKLPKEITTLTGITEELLRNEGVLVEKGLSEFLKFVGKSIIVGYNIDFDISFINEELKKLGKDKLNNKRYDLMKYVKNENLFLDNYKLQTVLKEYGIDEKIPHRATLDAKIIYKLSTKVNEFQKVINKK